MKAMRKIGIMLLVLLAFGAARMQFERGMLQEFQDSGLIRRKLEIDTRDRVDQTSMAVALGGLRTLVATFMNLRAHTHFEEQNWDELEDTYNTIVDLAPHTRYYWEIGAWHLSYNASSYYVYDSELPALRRRELWRSFVRRGRDFLKRAIRNNPEDWSLYASLAHLYRDPNKLLAFSNREARLLEAADAYQRAIELGGEPPMLMERFRLYCMIRVPEYTDEALEIARKLYALDRRHHTTTLLKLLYVLEFRADPTQDVEALALRLFGDAKMARKALAQLWQKNLESYPTDGVSMGLVKMEQLLGIPMPQSILAEPPRPPRTLEEWFADEQ